MQLNLPMEGGGSEHASSSDDGQFIVAFRKMMKKEIEVMVIRTFHQVIGPIVEDLIRKVVKEEIQSAVEKEKLSTGGIRNSANEITMSKERNLQLKILDEVLGPVLTGKPITGNEGTPIEVSLIDKTTGEVIRSGPASSAKVEIVVLDSSGDDNEHNLSLEDFNTRIIREGDKTKPHFARSNYIYLKEGVAVLRDAKLGHNSSWMKSCECRLGARVVENFQGVKVEEAQTNSFTVLDSRSRLYGKHYPPSLSDDVWRLENIGKDGARCTQLNNNKIWKVKDFLFLHSIDPQRLRKIVDVGAKIWKGIVDHAQTRILDDEGIYVYYPSEFKTGVAFDAVGGLKGAIHDSYYVPINNLSADEKDCAHSLLLSAFDNRNDIISFPDETSLQSRFPYKSTTYINAAVPMVEELYEPYYGFQYPEFDSFSDLLGDNEDFESLFSPENDNLCGTLWTDLQPHRQSNACSIPLDEVASIMIWMVRARKRFLALGGIRVQKRQRI